MYYGIGIWLHARDLHERTPSQWWRSWSSYRTFMNNPKASLEDVDDHRGCAHQCHHHLSFFSYQHELVLEFTIKQEGCKEEWWILIVNLVNLVPTLQVTVARARWELAGEHRKMVTDIYLYDISAHVYTSICVFVYCNCYKFMKASMHLVLSLNGTFKKLIDRFGFIIVDEVIHECFQITPMKYIY